MAATRGRRGGQRGVSDRSSRGARNNFSKRQKSGSSKGRFQMDVEASPEPAVASAGVLESEDRSDADFEVSSSDEEVDECNGKLSYTSLLQALNANVQTGEPARKKRRTDPPTADQVEGEMVDDIYTTAEGFPHPNNVSLTQDKSIAGDSIDGSEEDEQQDDPFRTHFSGADLDVLNGAMQADAALLWQKSPRKLINGLKVISASPNLPTSAQPGIRPARALSDAHLKPKLQRAPQKSLPSFDGEYAHLAGAIFGYTDVLFNSRTVQNGDELRKLYSTHALNHLLKTRDKVIKNNARLSKADPEDDDGDESNMYRDQGFTRPRVLVLVPTRQACSEVVDAMMALLQPEQQENRKRFKDGFSEIDDLVGSDKPEDFKELFAGNDDDRFVLGVKLTRKTVKYYSSFYKSDIILASPLGLHAKITAEDKKKRDWDFLSSIEVLIVDQANSLIMQNWENVETVFEHLNLEPKESHGCDFARVRRWYLDKRAKFYRQTLVFSAFNTAELNALFERNMLNVAGKHKFGKDSYEGSITRLVLQFKQTFARFEAASPSIEPEARFKYFTTAVLPVLARQAKAGGDKLQGTLIFIPSYMDFLRLQNFFCYSNDTQGITFDPLDLPCISEYASKQQNARARSLFQSGKHSILLYTGRAHHFYRYSLRGVKRVLMYSLPDNPIFYEELVGQTLSRSVSEGRFSPDEISAQTIFSRYDALQLERVVGSTRFATMLRDKGDTFEFS